MLQPAPFSRAVFRCAPAVCLALLISVSAHAQATGTIEGTVRDSTTAPVVGARVSLVVAGQTRSAVSDSAGHYRFDSVPEGRHRVTAIHPGMASVSAEATVAAGPVALDLTLGSVVVSENVSVTGVSPGVTLDAPTAAASRLGLTARETPATINVITFEESQARGLGTTVEALTRVPGVSASNIPSTFATSMRGFTAQAVSTLFDGTRQTTSTMVMRNFDSWNFDRIEVLKGPASVLYGEGALAGAVNFVSKKPDFSRRRSEGLISFGSLKNPRTALGTTGPIGDGTRAAYRADVVFNRTDGYIAEATSRTFNASTAVELKLTPRATLSLSVDHFRDTYDSAYGGTPLIAATLARDASDVVTDSRGLVLDRALRDSNFEFADSITQSHSTWLRARLDWRLGDTWRLMNETYGYRALREWKNSDSYGFDATRSLVTRLSTAITHYHDFFGNRLTLSSDRRFGGRRNRLTVGLEANHNRFLMPRRFGTTTSVDPFAPARGTFPDITTGNFPGAGSFVDFTTDLTLVSVFAEEAFSVAPRVTLVGGLRYDHLLVDRSVQDYNTGTTTPFDRTFEPMSGRGGVVIDVVKDTQLFAHYTSAVAPVSTVPIISQTNARFDLTTGQSWEGGLKSTLGGGRVETTAAVFRVAQRNILTRDPNNANLTIQGGEQSSTGVELAIAANVTTALRIDANATVMRAQFDRLIEAGGVDRTGNVPTNVPERTAGLWATYRFTRQPLVVSGGVRGQGRYFANNANSVRIRRYALLDAQASWQVGNGDVTLRGKNLTDTFYVDWGLTANQVMIGMPRVVELTYQFRF